MSPMKKCGGHSIITKHKPKPDLHCGAGTTVQSNRPVPHGWVQQNPTRLTVTELKMAKDVSIKKHGFAKSTNIKYNQQLREARTWLKELVETEQSPTIPLGADELDSFDWMPGELEGAFNNIPTRASPWVLGLFIAYKCFTQKTKVTTAWQIHAAFKQVWETVDPNGRWSGPWRWDHEKGTGCGNPANSREVERTIDAIKRRDGNEGSCSHSAAMTKQDMDRMVQWSNKLCPDSRLEELGKLSQGEYWKQLPFAVKHFMMRAFATSGFTLWTRNFELAKLQYKHLTLDLKTNDNYRYAHFKVSLLDRKNWAHHQTRDEIIHEVDNYNFPAIGSNRIARIETPIPHDTIQKWLDEFVGACEINLGQGRLTTHCFRRGGAQYRFMYAHFGKRWSLAVIQWWGGWAEGEHRDTLIRYLLDKLYHYEESHGDALRLISHEADRSFLSKHIEMRLPSKLELREMMVAQTKALKERILASLTAAAVGNTAIFAALGDRNTDNPGGVDYAGPRSQPSQTTLREMDEIDMDTNAGPAVLTLPENCKLYIPSIAWKGPLHLHWKQIIRDWECADPPRGHYIPLKDWDPEWLRGENRTMFGVKYRQRKLVAIEYIDRCQRDETVFLTKWPAAREGPKRLLKAITDDLKDRKLIKSRRGHKFK
ncbi:hypothetical protein BU17DRAFT_81680 [Hysterangium stoloniferum]|nr:hypothetical protein BU17DRAFT_81680 [Hysterangium stoloniferum]